MKTWITLPLALLIAAGPAAAQSSGCVRDSSGALACSTSPAPILGNQARRQSSTRELSAAALARSRAQLQAMREQMDGVARNADARAAGRQSLACPASPPPRSGSAGTPPGTCGR